MINKLVEHMDSMAQRLQQQQQTTTAIPKMASELHSLTETIDTLMTGSNPRDHGPKETIVWKPLQID